MPSERTVTVLDHAAYGQPPSCARMAVDSFTAHDFLHAKGAFTVAVRSSLREKSIATRSYRFGFWIRVVLIVLVPLFLIWIAIAAIGVESNGVQYGAWSLEAFLSATMWVAIVGMFVMPAFLAASLIGMSIFVKIAGRSWINTRQVRRLWIELEGYRRFLEATDLSRIQFESENNAHNPVAATLPYAMVFNMETKWRERLKK